MALAQSGPAGFTDLIGQVDHLLRAVEAAVDTLYANTNRVLATLPGAVADALRRALDQLAELISGFYGKLAHLLTAPGLPPALSAAARTWQEQVAAPAGELAAQIAAEQSAVGGGWKGPAGQAYAATLPAQHRAVTALQATAAALDAELVKTAGALTALWTGIAGAVARYETELKVAAAGAASIVGAPAAASAAAAATVRVTGSVTTGIAAFTRHTAALTGTLIHLRSPLYGDSFPNGEWPPATAANPAPGKLHDKSTGKLRDKSTDQLDRPTTDQPPDTPEPPGAREPAGEKPAPPEPTDDREPAGEKPQPPPSDREPAGEKPV